MEAELATLLQNEHRPLVTEPDEDEQRRLKVASHVYMAWTEGGARIENIADRFVDGSFEALDVLLGKAHCDDGDPAPPVVANDTKAGRVDVRHADELSYAEFVVRYMAPNVPVVIQGVTHGWPAQRDWVLPDGDINLQFLEENFGGSVVTVTDTSRQAEGCSSKSDVLLSEYLATWRNGSASRAEKATPGIRSSACPQPGSSQPDAESTDSRGNTGARTAGNGAVLYLKDWHFAAEHPNYQAYTTPVYFRDDWLNDYYDLRAAERRQRSESGRGNSSRSSAEEQPIGTDVLATSDYRFVYMGPKGTWTPLHADVLRSFSWSVNVAGAKRWRLLAPQHTHLLCDRYGRHMAPAFHLPPGSEEQYPNLAEARRHVVEVQQGIGEALFVPSGWHHTVENTADTLSINHNWLNGHNLHWGAALLRREHAAASEAIEDCRSGCTPLEFEALVQRNMAANAGLGYAGLAELACTIARRELLALESVQSAQLGRTAAGNLAGRADVAVSSAEQLGRLTINGASGFPEPATASKRAEAPMTSGAEGADMALLQHRFNLRRTLFVLEDLEAHA